MKSICASLVFALSVAPANAAESVAGFPVEVGRAFPIKGLSLADLDANGSLEVVAIVGEGLAVVGNDGQMWSGFPKGLRDATSKTPVLLKGPPTVCDLDGDGRSEIAVAGSSRMVYALSRTGAELPGFPVKLEGNPRGPLACLPGAGGRGSLVFTTDAGVLVAVAGTGGAPRTIARVGRGAEGGVAVVDLDGDGTVELITGGGDSRLYVFDVRGKIRKGFPYKMAYRTSGIPAVGDIDDDGAPDIVFGSQDFKIHALSAKGEVLKGFPVATKYRIYGGAALVDLNGDWVLDVAIGSGDKNLYAVDGGGKAVHGFPVRTKGRIDVGCVAGDVDRDGTPDLFTVTESGALLWHDAAGKPRKLKVAGKVVAGPVLGDLDVDGAPEVVFATKGGTLHALELGVTGKAEKALLSWPQEGHDAAHSGRYGPNDARFRSLAMVTAAPATIDALEVKYRYFDLDWQTESNTRIRWYRDGKRVPELDDTRSVAPSLTAKHQKWSYTLQGAGNHGAFGEKGVLSRVYRSPAVEVRNTAPTAPGIDLSPGTAWTTTAFEVEVTTPSVDADKDAVSYRYVWLRDGKLVKPKAATRVVPRMTRKNQEWRIVVVPFDGEQEGANSEATIRVINTPPGQPRVAIEPAAPRIDHAPRVVVQKAAPDDDGDVIHYTHRYWVNGKPLNLPEALPAVPARALRKHQKVRVEVVAHDDEEAGGKVEAEFEVQNTPPPPPEIAIWPAKPRTTDELRLGVLSQASDADGDPIVLEHRWSIDGKAVDFPAAVAASATRKGQRWRLQVTPFDGESRGKAVVVHSVIQNAPPEPPLVALPRYQLTTDETVIPKIVAAARDDDGDAVALKYRWVRDGKGTGGTGTSLAPTATAKGQKWAVHITPHDGVAEGRAVTLRFAIVNSPPSAPGVAVSNANPTVRDRVDVQIASAASDEDGDRLTYRTTWVRDGKPVAGWNAAKMRLEAGETRKGQRWRVEVRAFDGEAVGEPGFADLVVANHAPAPPKAAITPKRPNTTEPLQCGRPAPGTDPDGDALTYQTRWLVDGKPVLMSPGTDRVPSAMTREKQVWQCEVAAFDGGLRSKWNRSKPVTVENTPPRSPTVSIVPAAPTTDEDLICQLDRPSEDPDLDLLSYRFVWRLNGKASRTSAGDANRVPASATRRGQTWQCLVTPSDGEVEGHLVRTEVVIRNSPPTAPRARVVPERARVGQELKCEIVEPSRDADGDRVRYGYVWLKDGVAQSFAATSARVPGRLVKARDLWQCKVTPNDGKADGEAHTSENVTVRSKR